MAELGSNFLSVDTMEVKEDLSNTRELLWYSDNGSSYI